MSQKCILAIDQGSGSTKTLLLDQAGEIIGRGNSPVVTSFPQSGWVQQDPEHIWETVKSSVREAIDVAGEIEIQGIGLSTQRESLVVWSRTTGKSILPVLTWQDRSSAHLKVNYASEESSIREISGLPLDPMFSALKAVRILAELPEDIDDICIGTIDSWLLWKLSGEHVIERGNASRTQLVDLVSGDWSEKLLKIFGISFTILPRIVDSNFKHRVMENSLPGIKEGTPVSAVLGDSHAALFAHAGWIKGRVKATFGTGSSIMTISSETKSAPGLCRTIAWSIDGQISLALEANILSTGSTLVWLSELFNTSVNTLVNRVSESTNLVHIIPAFNGLAAPYWDEQARGIITDISLGTTQADIASAGLDSIAMQVADVLDEVRLSGAKVASLRVDGGATQNSTLLQRQADFADVDVEVPRSNELSAIGAGNLAGLTVGLWTFQDLEARAEISTTFRPTMSAEDRSIRRSAWKSAVLRARVRS